MAIYRQQSANRTIMGLPHHVNCLQQRNHVKRWIFSLAAAGVAFPVSFEVFRLLYIRWAERQYPHDGMIGLAALINGLLVGLIPAAISFVLVLRTMGRKKTQALSQHLS